MHLITPAQCRAARALLNWSQPELSDRCGVHVQTISNFENESATPTKRTLDQLAQTLMRAGVEFSDGEGVRWRQSGIKRLQGHEGFSTFLDDVYQTAIEHGNSDKPLEIFLSNVVHQNWIKWMGEEKWKKHADRMNKDKEKMDVRIIVKEGDYHFPAGKYSQYRWFPKSIFSDKSFYSYHDRLAFLDFKGESAEVTIMQHKDFAEGYRNLFRIAWDLVAKIPPKP